MRLTRRLWRVAVEALVGIDFFKSYDMALMRVFLYFIFL
jgi:hypothetical protein